MVGLIFFFDKGTNKFTFTDYIFGTKEQEKEKRIRDSAVKGKKLYKNIVIEINDEKKIYTDTEPPISLNIYIYEIQ